MVNTWISEMANDIEELQIPLEDIAERIPLKAKVSPLQAMKAPWGMWKQGSTYTQPRR